MSKAIKSVGRFFKKVGKAVKKIIKPVAIAVAAYFTAGVALSFIPATAGFAASLPGFAGGGIAGLGVGSGATAGTGIFSKVATTIGLGGGLSTGALQGSGVLGSLTGVGAASVADVAAVYGPQAAAGAMAKLTIPGGSLPAGASTSVAGGGVAVTAPSAVAGAGGAGAGGGGLAHTLAAGGGGTVAAKAGMSVADKLILAQTGVNVAGALFGPTEEDIIDAQNKFPGAFYGTTADGKSIDLPGPMNLSQESQRMGMSPGPRGGVPPAQNQAPTSQQMIQTPPQGGQGVPGAASGAGGLTGTEQADNQVVPGSVTRDRDNVMRQRERASQLFDVQIPDPSKEMNREMQSPDLLFGQGQMRQQYEVPDDIFAPAAGVRYV